MLERLYLFPNKTGVMQFMKKRLLTMVAALLLAFAAITPAFGASERTSNEGGTQNSVETELLNEFKSTMAQYKWLKHQDQYNAQARSAVLDKSIDLNATAKSDFEAVMSKCEAILATCSSSSEAYKHVDELLGIINPVAKKYNMRVSVDPKTKDATVWIIDSGSGTNGNNGGNSGKSTVAGSTSSAVKQTGFGLAQTAAVVIAAAAVLSGAFFFARKNNA